MMREGPFFAELPIFIASFDSLMMLPSETIVFIPADSGKPQTVFQTTLNSTLNSASNRSGFQSHFIRKAQTHSIPFPVWLKFMEFTRSD